MTPTRKRRLAAALAVVVGVSAALALILNAFQDNLLYFVSPSEVVAGEVPPAGKAFRIGGLVVEGSVNRPDSNLDVNFQLTDTVNVVDVKFAGILPDLFREGQGIVAKGAMNASGIFVASQVLAKHDENYMPPEAAEAIEQAQKTLVSE